MNNKKINQIIDEAYENYEKSYEMGKHLEGTGLLWMTKETKETFIYRSKTDSKFSQKWGLKIEERELSLGERKNIWLLKNTDKPHLLYHPGMVEKSHPLTTPHNWFDEQNIPTKLITITYNDIKTEIYE